MEIDCYGKVCADFSAGKGDIIDYLKSNGAERVIGCEINEELCKILSHKCELIGRDFFKVTSSQVSHVQYIVINPPFSNADKHILHAWKIAPEGSEITSLCNWQTLDNGYSSGRTELNSLIENYGTKKNLGNCFTTADRKTNVEVGMVKLFKPAISSDFDFDGFFFIDEQERQGNGIMPYDEIRAVVNSYVAAIKCFDKCQVVMEEMNLCTKMVGFGDGFKFNVSSRQTITTKEEFSREMQMKCWKYIFDKINVQKYVTTGVMKDINKFINSRLNYPFTMNNVYRMIEIIIGTREQIMNRAIVEAIDNFTRYTHENRFGVEGWKTNAGYLLNKKFICNRISRPDFSGKLELDNWHNSGVDDVVDLMKALCYLTGTNFDTIPSKWTMKKFSANTWYEWGFFDFKVFKKGSGHFKFRDQKVWELLNRTYAKIKGQVLPEKI